MSGTIGILAHALSHAEVEVGTILEQKKLRQILVVISVLGLLLSLKHATRKNAQVMKTHFYFCYHYLELSSILNKNFVYSFIILVYYDFCYS